MSLLLKDAKMNMCTQDLCQRQYCVLQMHAYAIWINEFNFTIATVKTNVKWIYNEFLKDSAL